MYPAVNIAHLRCVPLFICSAYRILHIRLLYYLRVNDYFVLQKVKYYTIKENSIIARLAAKKLKGSNAAIVFGHHIHLFGVSKQEFLAHTQWLRHELKHVEQYERLGYVRFIATYLWQTLNMGYRNCGLECEARNAEKDESIINNYQLK